MGFLSILVTFFFSFIGTFCVRLFIVKQSIGKTLLATFLHALPLVLFWIPILGWAVIFIVHLFFVFKNYTLVNEQEFVQRLEREKQLNEISSNKEDLKNKKEENE